MSRAGPWPRWCWVRRPAMPVETSVSVIGGSAWAGEAQQGEQPQVGEQERSPVPRCPTVPVLSQADRIAGRKRVACGGVAGRECRLPGGPYRLIPKVRPYHRRGRAFVSTSTSLTALLGEFGGLADQQNISRLYAQRRPPRTPARPHRRDRDRAAGPSPAWV